MAQTTTDTDVESTAPAPPPEQTIVAATARRPIGFDSFADLTAVPVVEVVEPGGVTCVTFATTLDDRTRQAVWERMTSADEADRTSRSALMQARNAAATAPPEQAAQHALTLALLLADRELGHRS